MSKLEFALTTAALKTGIEEKVGMRTARTTYHIAPMAPQQRKRSTPAAAWSPTKSARNEQQERPILHEAEDNSPTATIPSSPPSEAAAAADDNSVEEELHLDEDNDDLDLFGFEDGLKSRIKTMRNEQNRDRGSYYITKVPDDLQFGTQQTGFNMSNFLVNSRNFAVTIYVCGYISSLSLFDSAGKPLPRVWISIRPISESDSEAAARVLNQYSFPPTHSTRHSYNTIIAGRIQIPFEANKAETDRQPTVGVLVGKPIPLLTWAKPKQFNAVYTTTDGLRNRVPLDPNNLHRGDLVVEELRLRKRFDTEEGTTKERHYHAMFQLRSVTVIKPADPDAPYADNVEVDW